MPVTARCLLTALLLTVAGCNSPATVVAPEERAACPQSGFACTVHLRRDMLGVQAAAPIPVASTNHNGADIGLRGTIYFADKDWLVLQDKSDHSQQWIPRNMILYLDVQPQ